MIQVRAHRKTNKYVNPCNAKEYSDVGHITALMSKDIAELLEDAMHCSSHFNLFNDVCDMMINE